MAFVGNDVRQLSLSKQMSFSPEPGECRPCQISCSRGWPGIFYQRNPSGLSSSSSSSYRRWWMAWAEECLLWIGLYLISTPAIKDAKKNWSVRGREAILRQSRRRGFRQRDFIVRNSYRKRERSENCLVNLLTKKKRRGKVEVAFYPSPFLPLFPSQPG